MNPDDLHRKPRQRRVVFMAVAGVAGLAIGGVVLAMVALHPHPQTTTAAVAAPSSAYTVAVDGAFLDVSASIQSPTQVGYLDEAAIIAQDVASRLKSGDLLSDPGVKTVKIDFATPSSNGSNAPVMTVDFKVSALQKAELDRIGPYAALGMSDHVMLTDPSMRSGVAAWCGGNPKVTRAFCRRALAK